jgi:serine protease Do
MFYRFLVAACIAFNLTCQVDAQDSPPASPLIAPRLKPSITKGEPQTKPIPLTVEAIAAPALPALVTVFIKDARGDLLKSGSGFFIEPKKVVTNVHVISGGGVVRVATLDKHEYSVVAARTDEEHDLALLDVPDAVKVNALPLGNPETVAIGESVVAAGSPLGMQGAISTGIVSAKRLIKGARVIQTTAPISQGSSGDPLINSRGEVIGINSFLAAGGQNLNFAHVVSDIAALRNGGGENVDFQRGETVTAKSDAADPNQDAIVSLLAQASFSGTEFKQSLIGESEMVLLDPVRRQTYFALKQDIQDSNDRARVDAAAEKFVADIARVSLGSDDGMQSRFPGVVFRRTPDKWLFFSTDIDNLRLRTGGALKFKFKSAEFSITPGELKSFLSNASIRGGALAVNTTHYAKELGRRSVTNWGAVVARPGEPSLARLARDLTKDVPEPERKMQRLVDFVAGEIATDGAQGAGLAKRASEVLMTRKGTVSHKAVLLASLFEQIPIEYIFVYSGQDVWVAVRKAVFAVTTSSGSRSRGPQWTMLDVSKPGFVVGQTKAAGVPDLNSLVLAQRPQQDGKIYHRTTGMPVGNL